MILQEKSLKIKIFLQKRKMNLPALLRCCAFVRVAGNQQSPADCNLSVLIKKNGNIQKQINQIDR